MQEYDKFSKSQKDFYIQIEPLGLDDIEINDWSGLPFDNKTVLDFRIKELNKIRKAQYDFWFKGKLTHKERGDI
jgi:hypothetical protein